MKLNKNEKSVLIALLESPRISAKELAKKLGITTQAVGKIKHNLYVKGIINKYETILDYKKLGIECFAFTLVKIMPKAFRRYKKEINEIFSHQNIISLINIPQTSITNIILFGFRDVSEYDHFFKLLQSRLPGLVEIKDSYVFSYDSFIKNSASDLFIKTIREFGEKDVSTPKPPVIKQREK
jgi:DNA-binding Lrp family transcriptional regulator